PGHVVLAAPPARVLAHPARRGAARRGRSGRKHRTREGARVALEDGNHKSLPFDRRTGGWGRSVARWVRILVFLMLAVAVPATAQTFGFSVGSPPQACLTIG